MTIDTLFNKFIKNEKLDNFKTIKDDMVELKKQMTILGQENSEEYLKIYKKTANNMKVIFIKKLERNPKKY